MRGVRHMPSVLTGARGEPRHSLSQGLLGETAPLLHLLGLSPTATMETANMPAYKSLHDTHQGTFPHELSQFHVSDLYEVSAATHISGISNT